MFKLYGVFLKDFVNSPIIIDDKIVGYYQQKSKHPILKETPKALNIFVQDRVSTLKNDNLPLKELIKFIG